MVFKCMQVLEDCVGKSMQAACKRLAGGLSQACSENMRPEERLTAVAKGIDGLFEEITARYTPVLSTDVLNAVSLAAEQLYRLLTPQIQVWLSQGKQQAYRYLKHLSREAPDGHCKRQ